MPIGNKDEGCCVGSKGGKTLPTSLPRCLRWVVSFFWGGRSKLVYSQHVRCDAGGCF